MNLLLLSPIDPDTIEELRRGHDVVCAFAADAERIASVIDDREVVILRSGVTLTADLMKSAPDLKLVVRAGSGFDNIDVEYLRIRGLALVRIPEPGAKAVAELTFAHMLALSRRLLEADRLLRLGRWTKGELPGYLLTGKVLGVIGAGCTGSRVGQLGAAWGMDVIGCVEHPSTAEAAALAHKGVRLTDFREVLSRADVVSIHVPLNDSTRHLIDGRALARMKSGAFLINMARGGVVDEHALYHELTTEGRLRGAALDAHAQEGEGKISPLAELSNVVLTPHIGASTVDSQRELGRRIVSVISDFLTDSCRGRRHPAPPTVQWVENPVETS